MYWNSLFTRGITQLRLTEPDQFSSNYWYMLLRSVLGAGTRKEHRTCLSSIFRSDLDPVAGTMDYAMKQTMQKNAKKYKNLSLECMEYLAKT